MKLLQSFLFLMLLLTSCSEEEAPKDTETNRYYADYIQIYNAYDSLGAKETIKNLDIYLEEFPERKEAYIFKGYILGKMGDLEKADLLFEQAKEIDSSNIEIYEYQSSFLLYDETKNEQVKNVIFQGIAIKDSSAVLYNNLAWSYIFDGEYKEANTVIGLGLDLTQNNPNLYRTGYVAAFLDNNQDMLEFYGPALGPEIDIENMQTILKTEGAFAFYNSIISEY